MDQAISIVTFGRKYSQAESVHGRSIPYSGPIPFENDGLLQNERISKFTQGCKLFLGKDNNGNKNEDQYKDYFR